MRISRTETLRAYRTASLETYKANRDVLDGWVWLSALQPRRTCATCWAKHGSVHGVDEPFVSHPNCRCTPSPLVSGVPRRVQPGPRLFDDLAEDEQWAILGRGRYELFRDGRLLLVDIPVEVDAGRWGKVLRQRTLAEMRT